MAGCARFSPLIAAATVLAVAACDRGDSWPGDDLGTNNAPDAGLVFEPAEGPPPLGAVGYCGNQLIQTRDDTANLYFVIDASGSMTERLPGSEHSRFDSVRLAIADVLTAVGHRVRFGAAVFPGGPGCTPGVEVFPTRSGDPASFGATGTIGPVLADLLNELILQPPGSGTPLSATLQALTQELLRLEGAVSVVIATDGHPNCNPDARCEIDTCYYNMLGESLPDGRNCDDSLNCCDPDLVVEEYAFSGPTQCVDGPATIGAVQALATAGVRTYVLGLPDSFAFEPLLNALAIAGGTGRGGDQEYYPIDNATTLSERLREIGADVAVTCELALESAPPDPEMVNVYLDREILAADPENGWVFAGEADLELRGDACARLERGEVLNVQVVAGCPTEIR
ncbi:MAG: VWA domain-containing protein [Polyangiaceae bacterium]|nr:VWA domain-containing protein [Polyangiaceae bacterium]